MHRKVAMTIMALSLGGCFILTSPPASAQVGQHQQQGKTQGQSRSGASAVAPRGGGATRTVTPRATRTVTPRATRTVTPRGTRVVTAGKLRGMPARGAGRTTIRGHNYSVWRGGHRVRHGGNWRTFVALSALGAIAIGASEYYPYAYISAPEPYCEGLTEDGCQLMWQEVETTEGDVINQCVAYCPWQ